MTTRIFSRLAVLCLAIAFVVPLAAGPASASTSIDGAGSTWSQIAIDQWRSDVAKFGISVNYQGNGSTTGRLNYIQGVTDFGDTLSNVKTAVGFDILLYGLLAAVLVAMLGSALPSWLIAKVRPAEVMRTE